MALEFKIQTAVTSDVSELLITDKTGVYSVNNEGGYGTPNQDRAEIALVAYVKYQPYNSNEVNLTLSNQTSPLIDYNSNHDNSYQSEFKFKYHKDGWHKIALVGVSVNNPDTEVNFIHYNTTLGKLQIYNGTVFVDLVPEDWDHLLNNSVYTVLQEEEILMPKLIQQRNCALEKYISCLQCTSCKCSQEREELNSLSTYIQATDYRFHSDKKFEAQKMVEDLTKQYKCCK